MRLDLKAKFAITLCQSAKARSRVWRMSSQVKSDFSAFAYVAYTNDQELPRSYKVNSDGRMETEEQQVFTVQEAADWLRISRAKLYEIIASRDIGFFHIGRCIRLSRHALEEFVSRMECEDAG